jgi:hypothetical protein
MAGLQPAGTAFAGVPERGPMRIGRPKNSANRLRACGRCNLCASGLQRRASGPPVCACGASRRAAGATARGLRGRQPADVRDGWLVTFRLRQSAHPLRWNSAILQQSSGRDAQDKGCTCSCIGRAHRGPWARSCWVADVWGCWERQPALLRSTGASRGWPGAL